MTTTPQQALQSIESFVAANPEMAKEAPEQWAKLTKMRDALKKQGASTNASEDLKKLVVDLFRWQLEAQRADFAAQLAEVTKAHAKTPGPALEKTKAALAEVVKFLDEAKAVGFPPSADATAKLEQAVLRVHQAFAAADAAAGNTLQGVALKPVKRPIISSTGVPLKAAAPPPRAAKKK